MSMFGLWKPDEEPVDPGVPEHLCPVHLADWLALIARLNIPKTRKLVAVMAASWASHDGSEMRPALQTVADMSGEHVTNARKHLQALIDMQMLVVKRPGGGRGNPTVYRLTRPADLTVLPLWLDPTMRRVPAGAGFVPVETPAPSLENEGSSNTDSLVPALPNTASNTDSLVFTKGVSGDAESETLAPALPNAAETLASALGYGPVDNSAEAEKGSDSGPKPQCFEPPFAETLVPALPDLLQADQTTDQTPGLPQATASLGWRERAAQPGAFAALVGPPTAGPWMSPVPPAITPPPGEHAAPPPGRRSYAEPPSVIRASAVLEPTPAVAAAFAVLAAEPGDGEWFRAAAARELRREGLEPTAIDIAIRAVAILRRTNPETRSA